MTPSQFDHLRRIDAHLAKLLENAKKRTPGRWEVKPFGNYEEYEVHPAVYCGEPAESSGLTLGDAAYIASCAGNAEAGWESTRAVIRIIIEWQWLPEWLGDGIVDDILAQWPLELLANG